MEKFILDMLTTLGLGINGFIASYNCDKIEELFPAYTLFVHRREGEAIVDFTRKDTGEVVFTINFTTNEKGCITAMEFDDYHQFDGEG